MEDTYLSLLILEGHELPFLGSPQDIHSKLRSNMRNMKTWRRWGAAAGDLPLVGNSHHPCPTKSSFESPEPVGCHQDHGNTLSGLGQVQFRSAGPVERQHLPTHLLTGPAHLQRRRCGRVHLHPDARPSGGSVSRWGAVESCPLLANQDEDIAKVKWGLAMAIVMI